MNYTQTFEEFSKGVSTTDLALYAGVGIVLWVLFKDKLSPISKTVKDLLESFKKKVQTPVETNKIPTNAVPTLAELTLVSTLETKPTVTTTSTSENDLFFDLVSSWKQTRDLAQKAGCEQAVEVADQMFPYLSPNVCEDKKDE